MTFQDLVKLVALQGYRRKDCLTKRQAERTLRRAFFFIAVAVRAGDPVRIPYFGTFRRGSHKKRTTLNPQTGQRMDLPAAERIAFRAANVQRWESR